MKTCTELFKNLITLLCQEYRHVSRGKMVTQKEEKSTVNKTRISKKKKKLCVFFWSDTVLVNDPSAGRSCSLSPSPHGKFSHVLARAGLCQCGKTRLVRFSLLVTREAPSASVHAITDIGTDTLNTHVCTHAHTLRPSPCSSPLHSPRLLPPPTYPHPVRVKCVRRKRDTHVRWAWFRLRLTFLEACPVHHRFGHYGLKRYSM